MIVYIDESHDEYYLVKRLPSVIFFVGLPGEMVTYHNPPYYFTAENYPTEPQLELDENSNTQTDVNTRYREGMCILIEEITFGKDKLSHKGLSLVNDHFYVQINGVPSLGHIDSDTMNDHLRNSNFGVLNQAYNPNTLVFNGGFCFVNKLSEIQIHLKKYDYRHSDVIDEVTWQSLSIGTFHIKFTDGIGFVKIVTFRPCV